MHIIYRLFVLYLYYKETVIVYLFINNYCVSDETNLLLDQMEPDADVVVQSAQVPLPEELFHGLARSGYPSHHLIIRYDNSIFRSNNIESYNIF